MNKYKAIKVDGHKIDEHRYIMEQHIGRKLLRNEVVHHKNGNKSDNRLSNLIIMDLKDHGRMHLSGRAMSLAQRVKTQNSQRANCFNAHTMVTKEIITEVRKMIGTTSQRAIAQTFGLSIWAVSRIATGKSFNYIQ